MDITQANTHPEATRRTGLKRARFGLNLLVGM